MVTFPSKRVVDQRQRCLAIVRGYRLSVERKLAKKVWNADRTKISDAILRALKELEEDIENPSKKEDVNGFSFEELALAEEIIAEQEKNPFEE